MEKPDVIEKSWEMNVVIEKAEDLVSIDNSNKLKPFVSARVFGLVQTTKVCNGKNPKFQTKLSFPVYYPILNNKITVRVWHETNSFSRNVFIGNIPEFPEQTDLFNLTQLRDNDGRMTARWINIYGTPPMERSDRTKRRKEGSAYLGRVLIALNMISNDRPQLRSEPGNPIKEPRIRLYRLWVEMYDLIRVQVIPEGSSVFAVVSIGKQNSEESAFKYKGSQIYKCREKVVPEMGSKEGLKFPLDLSQVADIFVNFYVRTGNKSERFAYLRLKASDCLSLKAKTNWFKLTSPYNDTGTKSVGMAMLSVRLIRFDPLFQPERAPVEKASRKTFKFYC